VLGPARLAYLDPGEFRSHQGAIAVEQLPPHDPDLGHLISAASAEDVEESDIRRVTSPAFVTREHGTITSVAGYQDWPGGVAHVSVLTDAAARGRGLARTVASGPSVTRSSAASWPSGGPGRKHRNASPALLASVTWEPRCASACPRPRKPRTTAGNAEAQVRTLGGGRAGL
jgi:hypothetical protein